jgi:hypothetical protein
VTTIPAAPPIQLVTYDPGALQVMWRPITDPSVTGVRVYVTPAGGTEQSFDAPAGQNSLLVPITLNQTGATVAIAALNGATPGSTGPALPVLIDQPVLLLAAYDTTPSANLFVQWRPSPEVAAAGYVAVLDEIGTSNQWTAVSTLPSASFTQTLDPVQTYALTIRATTGGGVSQGPAAGPFAPILVRPAILLMTYDVVPSPLLSVMWRPPSGPAPAAYLALLQQAGTSNLWHQATQASSTTFTQMLDTNASYDVSVRVTDAAGVIQGPTAVPTRVITETPNLTALLYDVTPAPLLTATWTTATEPQVASWVAVLIENASGQQWTKTATTPQVQFAQSLATSGSYSLTVRATDAPGVVQGPASPALGAITATTTLAGLDYDGAALGVDWTLLPSGAVGGYTIYVAKDANAPTPYSAGLSGHTVITGALDPGASWHVSVRATDSAGIAAGPASPALVSLTSPPQQPVLAFTGTQMLASWTADTHPGVTGYDAQLIKNGTALPPVSGTANSAAFADTLDAGVLYSCAIRSTGPNVKGPWCQPANGPYRSVATLTYDGFGRLTGMAFTGGASFTAQYDTFGNVLTSGGAANSAGVGA